MGWGLPDSPPSPSPTHSSLRRRAFSEGGGEPVPVPPLRPPTRQRRPGLTSLSNYYYYYQLLLLSSLAFFFFFPPPPSSLGAARGPFAQRLTLNPEPGREGGPAERDERLLFFSFALCACSAAAGTAGRCSSHREGPDAQDKRPTGSGETTTPRNPRVAE